MSVSRFGDPGDPVRAGSYKMTEMLAKSVDENGAIVLFGPAAGINHADDKRRVK